MKVVLTSYRWPSLPSATPRRREKYRESRLPFPADTTLQAVVSTLPHQPFRCSDAASEEQGTRRRSIVIAANVSTFREIEISQRQFQKPQSPPFVIVWHVGGALKPPSLLCAVDQRLPDP